MAWMRVAVGILTRAFDMGLRVLCGQKGSGKTLYALSLLEQAVRAGRPTFTNIRLTAECPYVSRVGWLNDHDSCVFGNNKVTGKYEAFWHYLPLGSVVVIDEADNYFDCADHAKMDKDFKNYHKQLRKIGHDLIYIVQKVPNLNVRIRRLTDSFVVCEWNYRSQRVFRHLPISASRFLRAEFDEFPFRPQNMTAGGYWDYKTGARFFPWYWTKQLTGDTSFYSQEVLQQMGILEERHELSADQAFADLSQNPLTAERGNPFQSGNGGGRDAARAAAAALYAALRLRGVDSPAQPHDVALPEVGSGEALGAPRDDDGASSVAAAHGPAFNPDNAGAAFGDSAAA